MSAKNLSSVAQNLISTYGNTARNVVNAYRQGNTRAVGFIDQTWAKAVNKAGQRVGADLRQNAVSAQQTLSAYYVRGITLSSNGAETVVGRAVELANRGVDQVAANANRFEQATGITALSTLAQAAVPAAATVYQLAQRVEAGSETLVSKIAGEAVAAPKRRAKTTAKTAAKAEVKATPKSSTAKRAPRAAVAKKAPRARKAA